MDVGVSWKPREELMSPATAALEWSIGLFIGMVACIEVGYRFGRRSSERHPDLTHIGLGPIEAAVFALLGLLLGFSFAGGTTRLDARLNRSRRRPMQLARPISAWTCFPWPISPQCDSYFGNTWMRGFLYMTGCPTLKP
jgi:hypothetical protein